MNTKTNASKASKLASLEARIIDASASTATKSTTKPATKAAPTVKAAAVKVKSTVNVAYYVGQSCRPSAGARLFAYTAAWMQATGFAKGVALPRATIAMIAGATAVAYHINNGNFAMSADGVKLTAKGISAFSARKPDPQVVAGFVDVLQNGTPNKDSGVTKAHIVAIKAA